MKFVTSAYRMNYQQTLDYLFSQLPMFSRTGASAMTKDLSNTIALCKLLDNPERKFKSVHVGGTNGKGSTSHMLAAILQTAGYKTGLYTSPHLRDFRERIRISGKMISKETVVDFVALYRDDFAHIKPSFFEMTVGLAFDCFAKEQVDIAIIEVGLGGRLDSTNVINPLLSVITNIGWDHMNILGDTLPLIAAEKAGIIKKDTPVVIGEYEDETAQIFINKAKQENSPIRFASEEFEVKPESAAVRKFERQEIEPKGLKAEKLEGQIDSDLLKVAIAHTKSSSEHPDLRTFELDLTGTYQLKNLKTLLAAVDDLRKQGFVITDEHLQTALSHVKALTGLHGRWQTLSQNPLTICDTGHNPNGIEEVLKNIVNTPHQQLHFVLGMVNDKDISKVLNMLPKNAIYYFCKPDIPRGLAAEELQQQAVRLGLNGKAYPSVNAALSAAQQNAHPAADLVFAGGSTFVVAEIV